MKRILFFSLGLLLFGTTLQAQFHTLKRPQSSNKVTETQQLGVTDITISYHSPSVRDRDVWNDTNVIPQKGEPIPWRAGANMNTTITFSTDVTINKQLLEAGTYGLHIIPDGHQHTILFAHNHNQWGSYYLDVEQDVRLQVSVQDTICAFSEKLDFEFYPQGEDAMTIGLEWADRRIPFTVAVDLNNTVIASFRSELRGINTYHWQAWNDAANWCLQRDINLEEALRWASRSIEGGYGGFAGNKNLTNMTTKARLLHKLGRTDELQATIAEVSELTFPPYEANDFSRFLLDIGEYTAADNLLVTALDQHPGTWYLELNHGISQYFLGNKSNSLQWLEQAIEKAPERFAARLKEIVQEVEAGTYKLPGH